MERKSRLMLGVDLGGTSMMLVVMDARGKIIAERTRTTKPELGAEGVTERIAETMQRLIQDLGKDVSRVVGACIGAPGAVDVHRGIVLHAPNLGWIRYPLARRLTRLVGTPVLLDNDVNVAAVGEQVLGAARGARDVVAIFVGTGIGGGIIIGGQLYYGSRGSAGEIGHVKVLADGPMCGCGRRGCVEAVASRTAMERDIEGAIRAGRKTVLPAIMKRMGRDRITSSVIEVCLRENDPLVTEVFTKAQEFMGILVASVVNLLDPECIVIGGGLVERLGESYVGPIRAVARRHFMRLEGAERVRILMSKLLDHAGASGAAVMAWRRFRPTQFRLR